jgi:glycosyltransferase involved in cell wall biosynthesis
VRGVVGFLDKNTEEGSETLNRLFANSHFLLLLLLLLLLLPTVADCAPVVIAEANFFELPVITTEIGGIPTPIRTGATGMMFPLQVAPEVYGRSIAELYADSAAYAALARTSFGECQKRLNWSDAGEHVMNYLEVLAGCGRLSST